MSIVITVLTSICIFLLGSNCRYTLDISNYEYPIPDKKGEYTIAIFGTNDLHGTSFPKVLVHPLTKEEYRYGGVEYLARYIKILRKQWGDRFIWLDSGDQFQGGIESRLSKGTIMTDFLNIMAVDGAAIGNHEFDYGRDYLSGRLRGATFPYLAANIFNETSGLNEDLPNTQLTKLYTLGEVKIGVIGLSTIETPYTTAGDTVGLKFGEYISIIKEASGKLRAIGANAVILTSHVGMLCNKDTAEKLILNIRDKTTPQADCQEDSEMYKLLKSLEGGVIDAVVGGHVHDIVHHWVNGVPVIQSINGGYYSNILYLTFDSTTKKLKNDKIVVEGPLPTCEKVFTSTQRCDFIPRDNAKYNDTLTQFSFHGEVMEKDTSLRSILSKWWEMAKFYKIVIATSGVMLSRVKTHENALGNLMADVLRNVSQADISVINPGAFRTNWYPGSLTVEDVWNMCPFDNNIVTIDILGKDIIRMMEVLQAGKKGFYQTSGLTMNVTDVPRSLIPGSLKLYDGTDITMNKFYKLATLDFLIIGGGDDFREVLKFYSPVGLKIVAPQRESVIEFIKNVGYITESTFIDFLRKRLNVIK
jgi:2',3'-cyclic-nucleotide 2'-phosphodiesterase/3'-nucleotidase/5'-nucleotidase